MDEWTSQSTYSERVDRLRGASGGANQGYFFRGDEGAERTVFSVSDVDSLTGASGQDWFFANLDAESGNPLDKVTDQKAEELLADLDAEVSN